MMTTIIKKIIEVELGTPLLQLPQVAEEKTVHLLETNSVQEVGRFCSHRNMD